MLKDIIHKDISYTNEYKRFVEKHKDKSSKEIIEMYNISLGDIMSFIDDL